MRKKLKATPLVMIILKDVDHLEHDASSQYKFNRFWAITWFLCLTYFSFPTVGALLAGQTDKFVQYLILDISLWANFATHFGAMSGALAAMNTSEKIISEVQGVSEDVDDITEALPSLIDQPVDTQPQTV